MTNTEIINKLIGSITPYGDSQIDKERFENLKQMCNLVEDLILQIDEVSYKYEDYHQNSIKEMSDYANKFLTENLGIV